MVKRCLVFFFLIYVYPRILPVYMSVPHALLVSSGVGCQSEKDISPPELELGVVVSTHVCAGN